MKVTWEPADCKAGRVVGKPNICERWMIGYHAGHSSEENRAFISLTDGMVLEPRTRGQLVLLLNEGEYLPAELLEAK